MEKEIGIKNNLKRGEIKDETIYKNSRDYNY